MMKSVRGRVAVVTGGGSGIGRSTCEALARGGCHIAVVDIDLAAAEATAAIVRRHGAVASTHPVDIRDAAAVTALPEAVSGAHGSCHILVNNAGVVTAGTFQHESDDDLRWIIDTNIWGMLHLTRAFLPVLQRADDAHIVNLSSMVGLVGMPYNTSYALTKGAVRSFSEALRSELLPSGIGVTVVFPGSIRTNITQAARGTHANALGAMGRHRLANRLLLDPDVVARRIVRGIEHNRPRVVVGPDARLLDLLSRIYPGRSGLVGRVAGRRLPPPDQLS